MEGLCFWFGDDGTAKEEFCLFYDAAGIRKAWNCGDLKRNIVAIDDLDENPIVSNAGCSLVASLSLVCLSSLDDRIILVIFHNPNSQALSLLNDSFGRLHDVLAVGLDN